MLVLARIECLEIVPSEANCLLQPIQAVRDEAVIIAIATTGVSEWLEVGLVDLELSVGLLWVHLQNDHHEGAHEVGRVRDLRIVRAFRVVIDACLPLEAVGLEEFLELAAEPVRHSEVQRAKVLVERHVSQIL